MELDLGPYFSDSHIKGARYQLIAPTDQPFVARIVAEVPDLNMARLIVERFNAHEKLLADPPTSAKTMSPAISDLIGWLMFYSTQPGPAEHRSAMAKAAEQLSLLSSETTEVERLKEALRQVKAFVVGEKLPNWEDETRVYVTRSKIADICDFALAHPNHPARRSPDRGEAMTLPIDKEGKERLWDIAGMLEFQAKHALEDGKRNIELDAENIVPKIVAAMRAAAGPEVDQSATTPTITPELWSKLHLALGAAREYPDFDAGSPIRDYCDEALAELDRIAPEVLMRSRYVLRNTPDA